MPFVLQLDSGLLEDSTLCELMGKHNEDVALGQAIGDLLVLSLEGEKVRRHERDIIELHLSSSDGVGRSHKADIGSS